MKATDKITRNGKTITRRLLALIEDAYKAAGVNPDKYLVITQGSYHHGSLSGSTHDGGGAADLRTWNLPDGAITKIVVELRRRGCCAWYRNQEHGGFDPHIHLIDQYEPELSRGAKWQVSEYKAGRDGLNAGRNDYHPRPEQNKYVWKDANAPLQPPVKKPVVKVPVPSFVSKFGINTQQKSRVKAIQQGLKITVDGIFGPQTLAAVKAYQKKRPALWPADGVVGPKTYASITGWKAPKPVKPVVKPPTPKPVPVVTKRLTDAEIAAVARKAGFTDDALVLAIAVCLGESGGDPSCVNHNRDTHPVKGDGTVPPKGFKGGASTDYGLWQINDYWQLWGNQYGTIADAINNDKNAAMAYKISNKGSSWKMWSAYNNGSYKEFLPRARKCAGK